ncbi:cation diffusion facilitator family transporter [Jannaschia sp. W003]|uniref:cation diffusion facilitator family transporter n=1 Tax=Jannaschia sp. W003 TaxID=2867012 RepID=UPI0021A605FC|nr:cation diffusion facilitator family transporter [Jannaschia sp. W003]UWQ22188.1 cation diffusion facilitator family transporter [Jannaschia sp. W003]
MDGHGAHGGGADAAGRALAASAWLTGVYFVVELAVGLWTGSVAVISDAFHTFSAVGGVLIALVAARLARRPADRARSFGWHRAELLGALVNGAFLFVMALVVVVMAAMKLRHPPELETGPMIWVALGGIATEVVALWLLRRRAPGDLNAAGAWWHVVQTFVGSLVIIVAALVIRFTGFLAIDPILGLLFGLVLLWASWGLMRDAAHLLMDGTPPDLSLAEIETALEALPGVRDAHHLHAWALTGGVHAVSGHVRAAAGADPDAVLRAAHALLDERFGFAMITVQVETTCLDEGRMAAFETRGLPNLRVSRSAHAHH